MLWQCVSVKIKVLPLPYFFKSAYFKTFVVPDDFAIIHGTSCVNKNLNTNYTYRLDEVGNFYWTKKGIEYMYTPEDGQYCIEKIERKNQNGYFMFFCGVNDKINNNKFILSKILMIISSLFLVATIAVFIILRDTMNLHKKTLLSYCVCLLATYILLLIVQFNPVLGDAPCKTFGKWKLTIFHTFWLIFISNKQ